MKFSANAESKDKERQRISATCAVLTDSNRCGTDSSTAVTRPPCPPPPQHRPGCQRQPRQHL